MPNYIIYACWNAKSYSFWSRKIPIMPESIIFLLICVFQCQTLQDVVAPSYVNVNLTTQMASQMGYNFYWTLTDLPKKISFFTEKIFFVEPFTDGRPTCLLGHPVRDPTQLTIRLFQSLLASPSLAPCVNIEMESDPPAEQHTLGTVDFSLHGIWVDKCPLKH